MKKLEYRIDNSYIEDDYYSGSVMSIIEGVLHQASYVDEDMVWHHNLPHQGLHEISFTPQFIYVKVDQDSKAEKMLTTFISKYNLNSKTNE